MRIVIILTFFWTLLFITQTSIVVAQTVPFIHNSFNTDSAESLTHFCETKSHRYLFVGERGNPDSSGFIVLTDQLGNILRSRYLTSGADVSFSFAKANSDSTLGVYGIVKKRADSSYRYFYCRIDSLLNILYVSDDKLVDTNIVKSSSFSVNIVSTMLESSLYSSMIYEVFKTDSPTVRSYKVKYVKHNEFMDTVFTKSGLGLSCIYNGAAPGSLIGLAYSKLLRLDTSFLILDSMEVVDRNIGVPASASDSTLAAGLVRTTPIEITPNRIFVGIRFRKAPPTDNYAWGGTMLNMSTKSIVKKYCFPFHVDYVSPQSAIQPIVKHNNKIYYTGYYSSVGLFSDQLIVARHDTSGTPEWVKTYKSSSVLLKSRSIFGTSDGGILILATKDTTNSLGTIQQDLFVIKIDADGNPLSIKSLSAQLRPKVSVYPNPATDELYFAGLPNNATGICVFNSSGQLMSMHNLQTADIRISLQQLLPATYYYSVVDADGRVLSGGSFVKL